jgi:hypothetical protein
VNRLIARAAAAAAHPGGIRFTERQLYYELCRSVQPWHRLSRRWSFTLATPLRTAELGHVPGLLDSAPAGPQTVPDEVFDYGLPRLLLCQDDRIAHMLRANDLHLESACPVYSFADLPLDPRLRTALRHGGGTVYVLHDASALGLESVEVARDWAEDVPVNPLGLRPEHARLLHLPALSGGPRAASPIPGEHRWFATGRIVEVAAVNPARLLRTVHRMVRGLSRVRPRTPEPKTLGFLSWPVK